ncbi:16S rRNA (guanine(527)-N(7))-methyltransferase RsmG [Promicromonospora citrea]|uniref:Ribosomal RNA small subunit methyltransferase G n=1 Tax=Promicromonospora citrea TaxID=43677 RepID=A0A8H9GDY5_9MICO|nr:16S rRNA (guanine(527)-N(7))-methyltransferase RsmG [Promicromonospora citrea]NNH50746.1 16S rRNA (guanine(527)-N(7))-methyltransferase RsmG [Promicromonospora citrea]GGM11992.1 ribosomal RNA small subunit methyltransferase G [Promicromonospora citrea]
MNGPDTGRAETPADEAPDSETLGTSEAVRTYFGDSYEQVVRYAELLREQGELRGLIGPREVTRIWERHILNSAAVVPYLPTSGAVADIGSGAGLPGIVIAAMRPDLEVLLVEPMERRTTWLGEVVSELGLTNTEIKRGRAEEYHEAFEVDAVTSRAVAALSKLARMSLPLVRVGGEMVILKGRNVAQEVDPARKVLRRYGATDPEILEGRTVDGVEATTILRARRTK